jgi:hypothetical protein
MTSTQVLHQSRQLLFQKMTATEEEFHNMYYEYKSLLLGPSDGTMLHTARQDLNLVKMRPQWTCLDTLSMMAH